MIQSGYFLITDITGYTSFLTKSELDHANLVIHALFEAQLESIGDPLKVSNFQGDAILCYTPGETSVDGKMMLEQVTKIYQAFKGKMDSMLIAPPCPCTACNNIMELDLKVFLHYGNYMVRSFGERDELMGSDVILAHRMMKNDVTEQTGYRSYLLLTDTAYEQMAVSGSGQEFTPITQSYEHIGDVGMRVAPL